MQMIAVDGTVLTLTIVGYQFPDLADLPYDSNWLIVSIQLTAAKRSWTTTDSCLLTYEAQRLATWFDSVATGATSDGCSFIEPCLGFTIINGLPIPRIRVHLYNEIQPPQDDWEINSLDFQLLPSELHTLATNLRNQVALYPQRTDQ